MGFDFDEVNNRRGSNSLKWDVAQEEIPMWVADMDFKTAPAITEVMVERAKSGIYGYNIVPQEWRDAIIQWWGRRHQWKIESDWLVFTTGVIPIITCAVKGLTNVGDNVLVQTPVYDIFFHSIENHGRHVVENSLINKNGRYEIDYVKLEEQLANPLTTLMLLCNPQNPGGRIWSRDELEKIATLCEKYHVIVVVDEIHCDITALNKEYTPYASISETCKNHCIVCVSATKTFNIAGLQSAVAVIPSEHLRNIMERQLNANEVAEPNTFAIDAVIAAFCQGEKWLDELRIYLDESKRIVADYVEEQLPQIQLMESEATYLLWLDCRKITDNTDALCQHIRKTTGLYLTAGSQYRGDGAGYIRMNIACPKAQIVQALDLLREGIETYKN